MVANLQQKSDPLPGFNHSFTTAWEDNFDYEFSIKFLQGYWYVPAYVAVLYLPAVYIGQRIMKNREPFKLKTPLVLWNILLAVFSTVGFIRLGPELYYSLTNYGFYHSICGSYSSGSVFAAWNFIFALSKTPELIDTLFLVLKKQKLIFLHVYHHSSVVVFAWWVVGNHLAVSRWFSAMNYGVHGLMYSYYALKAFPNIIRIPKFVSMMITAMQTVQMVFGLVTVSIAVYFKLMGEVCDSYMPVSLFSIYIYGSYLYLFSLFFYGAYCSSASPHSGKVSADGSKKRA